MSQTVLPTGVDTGMWYDTYCAFMYTYYNLHSKGCVATGSKKRVRRGCLVVCDFELIIIVAH